MLLGFKDKIHWSKIKKSGTSFVTRTVNYGTVEESNQKVPLEKIILKKNTKKFHQNEGSFTLINYPRLYLGLRQYNDGQSVP